MALKNLTLRNFRGKTEQTYAFDPQSNLIEGRNGSGKTTLREAICFLFCGTDSQGSRNPQHLISDDSDPQDSMEIIGVTDRATISRTLTKKGNGTLKVTREGIPAVYTQSQLEQMLGSIDLFLSVLVPGFFLKMTPERQHKVLAEVTPKIDRNKLFASLAGFELGEHEAIRYDLKGRCDLVASKVALDRRSAEKELDRLRGQVEIYGAVKPLDKPDEPVNEIATLRRQTSLEKEWEEYHFQRRNFVTRNGHIERDTLENTEKAKRRAELESFLSQVKLIPEPVVAPVDKEIVTLRDKKKQLPAKPSLQNEVLSENCPTCGQIVGSKHLEKVQRENEKIQAEYSEELSRCQAHNAQIDEEMKKIEAGYWEAETKRREVLDQNRRTEAHAAKLRVELSNLIDVPVPPKLVEPVEPTEAYDLAARTNCENVVQNYEKRKAQYEYAENQAKEAKENADKVKAEIIKMTAGVDRLQTIEDAIRKIPQAEMQTQAQAFKMESAEINVGESIQLSRNGIPYEILSTGERMKAGKEWSEKLNELMARPINMIFIDNMDLVDRMPSFQPKVQYFLAIVYEGQDEVTINERRK